MQWKTLLLERVTDVFAAGESSLEPPVDVKVLHAEVGELTLENDFFRNCAHQSGPAERNTIINRSHTLPVTKQAKVLGISHGSLYYCPKPVSEYDQRLVTRMDRLHMEWPFAGARMLRDLLRQEGDLPPFFGQLGC